MPEAFFTIDVSQSDSNKRLDTVVASHVKDCSRSFAAKLIGKNHILVQGISKKPGYRVKTGERITGELIKAEEPVFTPEPIDIDVLYDDEDIIVINKRPGFVVHPGPGHYRGTLVNALLFHCPEIKTTGFKIRPGIVHRLDKDTSGVMVAAKNNPALLNLSEQFKSRKVIKKYLALVHGKLAADTGVIDLPVGRHPTDRKRMSTIGRHSRTACTLWRVKERFNGAVLICVNLKTGRTHQIRVHCSAIHHPVVGDPVYGSAKSDKNILGSAAKSIARQMLHSWQLELIHPVTGKPLCFEAPVPDDMAQLLKILREPN